MFELIDEYITWANHNVRFPLVKTITTHGFILEFVKWI